MQEGSFGDIQGRFASVGVTLSALPDKSFRAFRNGEPVFTFAFDPPRAQWEDLHLEAFLRSVLEFEEAARALQENRGPSTFGLRGVLRDRLNVAALLDAARAARVAVREEKHLTTKDIYFGHPAFGEFVRATVLRGQSHVVAVTFSTPEDYLAVTYPLGITDVCRNGDVSRPVGSTVEFGNRAPDLMDQFADRPLPTTQDEADALMADVFSAALGRRVERRPAESVQSPPSSRQLIVSADGTATYTTIGAALAAAADRDEIIVRPGDYAESLVIDKLVAIRGDGPRERIVVRPKSGDTPCISITANAPHISGLTVSGLDLAIRNDAKPAELIHVSGGTPVLEGLDIAGGDICASVTGLETAGAIRSCTVHDAKTGGIVVIDGALPRIEENEVWGNVRSGITIGGAGTNPLVRANRIHNGQSDGIFVVKGASPRIEDNEVWAHSKPGITIVGAGTDPLVRANRVHDGDDIGIAVREGASPRIEENEVWGNAQAAIAISDPETGPLVRANHVHDGQMGIAVIDGASPRIEDNEVSANALRGIMIGGTGTNPLVRANRVHDGQSNGILVIRGASPRIEENEVWGNAHPGGIVIRGVGTDPLVRANRVHDSESYGIVVGDRAAPRIETNEVTNNTMPGIWIDGVGTNPVVQGNRVHDGSTCGIGVVNGASPRIEENDVWDNAKQGILIAGAGTDPLVRANRVHDGQGDGIDVRGGACPRIEENEVWGNTQPGIGISGAGTDPLVRANRVHDGRSYGIVVREGASPRIEENELWGNAQEGI